MYQGGGGGGVLYERNSSVDIEEEGTRLPDSHEKTLLKIKERRRLRSN